MEFVPAPHVRAAKKLSLIIQMNVNGANNG